MSILGGLNQTSRGVQIYAPNGGNPLAPPAPRRQPPRPGGPMPSARQLLAMSEGQKKQKEEEDDQPWWQKGLGVVIGNRGVQAALKPLEVLDYGRRAVTLGVEEFAENLSGAVGGADQLSAQTDENGNLTDTRSNWDKLNDPSYGVGQLFGDTWDDSLPGGKSNYYANSLGFVGDVILDPLTWTTGIGGAVTKGGSSLNKANRAAVAAKMFANDVPEAEVIKFLRKGGAAVDQTALDSFGGQAPAFRVGTRKAVKDESTGQVYQGNVRVPVLSKVSELAARGGGEIADRYRNTPLGRTTSNWRAPEELAKDYRVLFEGEGGRSVREAASNVARENFERIATNSFGTKQGRQYKALLHKVRRLSDENQRLITDSLEDPNIVLTGDLLKIRNDYAEAYDQILVDAKEQGLDLVSRKEYTPHILTRDAAKWIRTSPDSGAAEARLLGGMAADPTNPTLTFRLNDSSGVTMQRKFQGGQKLNVNNNVIKFDGPPGRPVPISEVNRKFREAGLDFDYFETKADTILAKYIDMISGDVGKAKSLIDIEAAGYAGSKKATAGTRAALGLGDELEAGAAGPRRPAASSVIEDTVGGRNVQPDDVGRLSAQIGGDVQTDLLEVAPSTRLEPVIGSKSGDQKLTRRGKARMADGWVRSKSDDPDAIEQVLEHDDFVWDEIDETAEYNRNVKDSLKEQQKANKVERAANVDLATEAAGKAKQALKSPLDAVFAETNVSAIKARNAAKKQANDVERAIDAVDAARSGGDSYLLGADGTLTKGDTPAAAMTGDRAATVKAIDDLIEVRDQAFRSLDAMDEFLARKSENARIPGIAQVRRDLLKTRREAQDRVDALRQDLNFRLIRQGDPEGRARNLESRINAPVEAAEAGVKAAKEGNLFGASVPDAVPAVKKAEADLDFARNAVRQADAPVDAAETAVRKATAEAEEAVGLPAAEARLTELENHALLKRPFTNPDDPGASIIAIKDMQGNYHPRRDEWKKAKRRVNYHKDKVTGLKDKVEATPAVAKAKADLDKAKRVRNTPAYKAKKTRVATQEAKVAKAKAKQAGLTADNAATPAVLDAQSELGNAQVVRKAAPVDEFDNSPNFGARSAGISPSKSIRGDDAFSTEQLNELNAFMRARIDPGAQAQVSRLRNQARTDKAQAARAEKIVKGQIEPIDDELVGIINDPAIREAATQRGAKKYVDEVEAKQAEPRRTNKQIMEAADEEADRLIDTLGDADNLMKARTLRLTQAITDNAAAQKLKAETQAVANQNAKNLRRLNYDEIDKTAKGAAETLELQRHTDDMRNLSEDVGLSFADQAATDAHLLNADEMIKEVAKGDVTDAQLAAARKHKDHGRVVEMQLKEGVYVMAKNMGDDYIVAKAMMDAMTQKIVKAADDNRFWRLIDSLTGLFKTYATLTPGFHVRNALSAAFVNASEGVPMGTQLEGVRLMRAFRRSKDPAAWMKGQPKEIQEAFDAAFGSSIGGQFNEAGVGTRGSAFFKMSERAYSNWATKLSRRAGESVEGSVRLPLALDTIRNGGDVPEALMRVTRAHFDYSQTSAMDKKMKRLIPFWTFMSRNLPLQLTQMYSKPRTYAKYNSLIRNFQGEDPEGTPEYFSSIGAWRFQDNEVGGNPLFAQLDFAHTRLEEDIANLEAVASGDWGKAMSQFSPLVTAPIEYATEKNLYTGQDYGEPDDFREIGGIEQLLGVGLMAGITGNRRESPGGKTAVSENFLNAIRSVNPVYDRGLRLSPGNGNERWMEQIARFLGAPARTLSEGQQESTMRSQYYDDLDKQRESQYLAALDN